MKTIMTTAVVTLFATSVSAADIYRDIGQGNADLYPHAAAFGEVMGVQPSVGGDVDRYQGFADGNPDVFHSASKTGTARPMAADDDLVIFVGPGVKF